MKFLATVSTDIEKNISTSNSGCQKNLSFLEFFESEKFADEHCLRGGKLFLIRTAIP